MQRLPKAIPAASLAATAATLYAAPAGTTSTINNFSLTNTSANPVAVTLYRVSNGGTASAANCILSAYSLSAGQTYVPPQTIGLQMDPGMTLQGFAATASVVTAVGGVYETQGTP